MTLQTEFWEQYSTDVLAARGDVIVVSSRSIVRSFSGGDDELVAMRSGVGLVDRSYRGLVEITGADRAPWLHNLTTNHVKTLSAGDGNSAFVLNLKGRIIFDLNVLVEADSIWVDLDRQWLEPAKAHFDKYTIMEDVAVLDRSDETVRFGIVGKSAAEWLSKSGAPNAANWPALGLKEIEWQGKQIRAFRHDFGGCVAFDCLVPAAHAVAFWQDMTEARGASGIKPIGWDAVQACRIEAGIPWPGMEITEEYLPAETGQSERAVSFNKGCYLGQEVVERMRSRNVVARRLAGLQCHSAMIPNVPADLYDSAGAKVGKMTSVCQPEGREHPIGLGYVKTASSVAGTELVVRFGDHSNPCTVVALPFLRSL